MFSEELKKLSWEETTERIASRFGKGTLRRE